MECSDACAVHASKGLESKSEAAERGAMARKRRGEACLHTLGGGGRVRGVRQGGCGRGARGHVAGV